MQYMRLQIKINKINYIYRPNLLYTNPVVGKIPTRQNPDFFPLQNPTTFDKIGFFFYKNGKISAKKV